MPPGAEAIGERARGHRAQRGAEADRQAEHPHAQIEAVGPAREVGSKQRQQHAEHGGADSVQGLHRDQRQGSATKTGRVEGQAASSRALVATAANATKATERFRGVVSTRAPAGTWLTMAANAPTPSARPISPSVQAWAAR
jgi:hypothetical protein